MTFVNCLCVFDLNLFTSLMQGRLSQLTCCFPTKPALTQTHSILSAATDFKFSSATEAFKGLEVFSLLDRLTGSDLKIISEVVFIFGKLLPCTRNFFVQTTVCFCVSLHINKATFGDFNFVFSSVYFNASINYVELHLQFTETVSSFFFCTLLMHAFVGELIFSCNQI